MKKILFFSKSECYGGIEKVLVELCNNLDPNKYEITVLNWFLCSEIKDTLNKNIKYKYIFNKKEPRGVSRLVRDLPPYISHKIFIREKYDIEVAFQEGYTHKIISGASNKTKKIAWFHINPNYFNFNEPYFKNKNILEKKLNKFDDLCFVSKFMKEWYSNVYNLQNTKLHLVYNPINTKEVIKKSNDKVVDLDFNNKIFRIICVGRLSVEKQFKNVIKICNDIYINKNKNIELLIIGDGPQKKELKDLIDKYNANNYIKLIGFKRNPYKYIKKSNLLICSSQNIESFGLVVAEAMIINTPVLSVKCGGPDEILENGKNGMLVENNEEAIYKGLLELIENKILYNKYKKIKKNILEEFEMNKIIDKIDKIINS